MKNRVILASVAGAIAAVLLVIGLVLQNQANFSHRYVGSQLASHKITFTPVAGLNAAQKKVPCLIENAAQPLVTGGEAQCYALYQIGLDLPTIDNGRGYFQDNYAAYLLAVKTQQAVASNPNASATLALEKRSAVFTQKANALFDGETMRGLLLSAYGFSLLGDRAGQAALACFVAAGIFFLAMSAALVLALKQRRVPTIEFDGQHTVRTSPPTERPRRDVQPANA